jgi:hypothetical protein
MDENGKVPEHYTKGSVISLRAPGHKITVMLREQLEDEYANKALTASGTSFAAAFTSAAAAVIMYDNPDVPVSEVKRYLEEAAQPINEDNVPSEYGSIYEDVHGRGALTLKDIGPLNIETEYISVTDNLFRPDDPIKRKELAEMVYILLSETGKAYDTDIDFNLIQDDDDSETRKIFEFTSRNLSSGYKTEEYESRYMGPNPQGEIYPSGNVTRGEVAALVCAILQYERRFFSADGKIPWEMELPFSDVPSNHWARGYIYLAYVNGAIDGSPDGTFNPDGPMTRGEAVILLHRIFKRSNEPQSNDPPADILSVKTLNPVLYIAVMNGIKTTN